MATKTIGDGHMDAYVHRQMDGKQRDEQLNTSPSFEEFQLCSLSLSVCGV